MRIDEILVELPVIHRSIFESNRDYIHTPWIDLCVLEVGSSKEIIRFEEKKDRRLEKDISIQWLGEKWETTFGSDSIETACLKLKEMMLYMIFGINMLDKSILFNNGNLAEFLEASPCTDERLWAFQVCFGKDGCSVHGMKSKIARILK